MMTSGTHVNSELRMSACAPIKFTQITFGYPRRELDVVPEGIKFRLQIVRCGEHMFKETPSIRQNAKPNSQTSTLRFAAAQQSGSANFQATTPPPPPQRFVLKKYTSFFSSNRCQLCDNFNCPRADWSLSLANTVVAPTVQLNFS